MNDDEQQKKLIEAELRYYYLLQKRIEAIKNISRKETEVKNGR